MIGWLWRRLGLCGHAQVLRVRLTVDEVPGVLCFVCQACGHVEPAVSRSPGERRDIRRAGQVVAPRVDRFDLPRRVSTIRRLR